MVRILFVTLVLILLAVQLLGESPPIKDTKEWGNNVRTTLILPKKSYWVGEAPQVYVEFANLGSSRKTIGLFGSLGTAAMWCQVQLRRKGEGDWPDPAWGTYVNIHTSDLGAGETRRVPMGASGVVFPVIGITQWFTEVSVPGSYDIRCIICDRSPREVDRDGKRVWSRRWFSEADEVKFERMKLLIPLGSKPEHVQLLKRARSEETCCYALDVRGYRDDLVIKLTGLGEEIKAAFPGIAPLVIANLRNPRYQMRLIVVLKQTGWLEALPWMRPLVQGVYPFAGERESLVVWAIGHMKGWKKGVGYAIMWGYEENRKKAITWIQENIPEAQGPFPLAKGPEDYLELEDE